MCVVCCGKEDMEWAEQSWSENSWKGEGAGLAIVVSGRGEVVVAKGAVAGGGRGRVMAVQGFACLKIWINLMPDD